ncbi:hypothetical protein IE984_21215 [Klebsiella pneumoniae]|nr:hypothetical protein [Klebsiella pneumoniae]
MGQIGHAHRVVASRVEEALRRFNGLFRIKLAGTSRVRPGFVVVTILILDSLFCRSIL